MTAPRKPRLVWRRCAKERGLGSIFNSRRGWELRCGTRHVAGVNTWREGGWMWSASADELGIPWCNTAAGGMRIETFEEAKAQATEYVRRCLAKGEEASHG